MSVGIPIEDIEWFCDRAEFFRRADSTVQRGRGQPVSAQPDLSGFEEWDWTVSTDEVRFLADLVRFIANKPEVAEVLGSDLEEVRRQAERLSALAPDMIEWEAYEPPERKRWAARDDDYPDYGIGYSDRAVDVFAKVTRAAVAIQRILRTHWEYAPERPLINPQYRPSITPGSNLRDG